MAQNITLLGASYSDVPAVNLPKTGGGTARFTDVSDTTATQGQVASTAYYYGADGVKKQGSYVVPSAVTQATPTISVNTSTGLITASATQSAGVVSAGTKSATEQLSTQAAQTLYPSTTDQTISSGKYLTGTQTFKGVLLTNLDAGNIKKDVVVKVGDSADDDRITSVTGTYEGSGGGGGTADYKAFIERSTDTPTLPSDLTSIAPHVCRGWSTLALASLPNSVTRIGEYAFYGCYNLALTTLPSSLTRIDNAAFYNCYNLAISVIPSGVTTIGTNAFQNCESLETISCDGVITSMASNIFIGSSTHPMALREVYFPNMATTSGNPFGSGTAANACQNLEIVDLGKTTGINGMTAFTNCYKLQTLVLRKTGSVCSLGATSAFTNTPMSGYNSLTGTVYVPNALIATYQTATNWKTLYNAGYISFVKIEGSIYE